jgi:hypothetical protein
MRSKLLVLVFFFLWVVPGFSQVNTSRLKRWSALKPQTASRSSESTLPSDSQLSDYSYSDDFSTGKAENDSYSHSPFVEFLPPIFLTGLLMYTEYGVYQTLGFYRGFDPYADAYLRYEFPLEGECMSITGGSLEVDVFTEGYNPILWIETSTDGMVWQTIGTISVAGHYEYSIAPVEPCTSLFLMFLGGSVFLDEFSLSLTLSHRGDANTDGIIDVSDVVYLITYLYKDGPAPNPLLIGDANCSGLVELGDVVYLITYLYKDGPPPPC